MNTEAVPQRWRWQVANGLSAIFICAVGVAVYGAHVLRGGFAADDWVDYSRFLFHPGAGFWAAVAAHYDPGRWVWAIVNTLDWAVLGRDPAAHLAQSLLIGLVAAILLQQAAMRLGLPPWQATAVAVLFLLFPDADSTRLWATGAQMALAVALALGGFVASLAALRRTSPAPRAALHLLALALYILAVGDYELVAPAILVGGGLLAAVHGWRRAGLAWLADAAVVLALLVLRTRGSHPRLAPPAGDLAHLHEVVLEAATVMARAVLPLRTDAGYAVLGLVLVTAWAGMVVAVAWPQGPRRRRVRQNLAALTLGGLLVGAGYVMIIPASAGYLPDSAGMQNRINAVSAVGFALVVASLAVLAAEVAAGVFKHRRALRAALALLLLVAVAAGYVARTTQHAQNWNSARRSQDTVLAGLDPLAPSARHGQTLFVVGQSGFSAPAIPIFGGGGMNDLVGALRVRWHRGDVSGYPLLDQMVVDCGGQDAVIRGITESRTPYGRLVLVDLRRNLVAVPAGAAGCRGFAVTALPYPRVNASEVSDLATR